MPNRLRWTTGLCVVVLAATFWGCGAEQVDTEPLLRPVRYEQVYTTGGTRQRSFAGVAEAGVESNLSFKVPGSIKRVAVKVGDSVRVGQLIAELDDTDHELEVERAQASLSQSEAQARRARSDYERTRGLYENRNASKDDLDQARSSAESADAVAEASRKALALANQKLSYCRLVAPSAGAIAAVPADENENIQPGQLVAVLTSGARKKVAVGVPGILIPQVREGDAVRISFDALQGLVFGARVSEVGVSTRGGGTTFPVTLLLDDAAPNVRPGMAAEVSFTFTSTSERERFLVPPVAVGEDREGRFLFVAIPVEGGQGTIERRAVTVGELTGEGLEVFDGLLEGDLLITAGVSKLTDGQTVMLPGFEADAS